MTIHYINPLDGFLRYLEYKNFSAGSVNTYRKALLFFSGKTMSVELIQEFQVKIQHLKPITRLSYLSRLKQYLKWHRPELIACLVMPKLPKALPIHIPSEADMVAILKKPDLRSFFGIRDRAVLELLYGSGLRRSEILNLKLEDVDWMSSTIRINQSKGKKDRMVPISQEARKWLEVFLKQVRPTFQPKEDFVFVSRRGVRPSQEYVAQIVKKYAKFSPHKYRHAYATHLLRGGMKETSLQKLLGHTLIATTQVYTKVTIEDLKVNHAKFHPRSKWKI